MYLILRLVTFTLFSAVTANIAFAGGYHWHSTVLLVQEDLPYNVFTFDFSNAKIGPGKNCSTAKVYLKYSDNFWSWLPFFHSENPSKQENEEAVAFLLEQYEKGKKLYFGYMRNGLKEIQGKACSFESKSFRLVQVKEGKAILSYYD